MSKKTGYLFGILITIIVGMILMWYFCCGASGNVSNEITTTETAPPDQTTRAITPEVATQMGFTLKDPDGNFAYSSNENFNFSTSAFTHLKPLDNTVTMGVDALKDYFSKNRNQGKFIDITGFYDEGEQNTSALPNLGLARATDVKNYFVSRGISSQQINTYGELRTTLTPKDGVYLGPINYQLGTSVQGRDGSNKEEKALAAIKDRLDKEPLVLYFGNAQSTINLSAEQRQKVADLNRYLDKVEGSRISITGHTDNTGSRTTNTRLGLKRANFAKGYFVRNGIAENKISTASKGPDEPIAPNTTEAGRAKNRRCVVTLN